MTHVCHLFDAAAGWEQRAALRSLLDRLPDGQFINTLATIGPAAVAPLASLNRPIHIIPHPIRSGTLVAPMVGRFVDQRGVELIHAWSAHAAASARAATEKPLAIELFDPAAAQRDAKLLRTLARPVGFAIVCNCEIVRRRLIEGGIPPGLCVVIRPGIDFGWINHCRRSSIREQLGVSKTDTLTIIPEPVMRESGSFDAFWAAALLNHLDIGIWCIVPGSSREQRRIARYAATAPSRATIISPGDGHPFERLIAVSDVLIVNARGDVSTTAIAWAMASGAAVIGSAIPSIAELIAHKVNGLLFKQVPGKSAVGTLVRLLQDRVSLDKAREVARGQAYEVFGLRRFIEQHLRVYDNMVRGRAPGEGITDSARVG